VRIAMLGSGGIGGYYGAILAKVGHDVVFIARGGETIIATHQALRILVTSYLS